MRRIDLHPTYYKKNYTRQLMKKVFLFSLVLFFFHSYAVAQGTAEEIYLENLLGSRHLPKYMHQDPASGLSELLGNPAPYLSLMEAALVFPIDQELDTYFDLRIEYGRILGLLESVGTEEARAVLERAYLDVVEDMGLLNDQYQEARSNGVAEDQRLEISRDADAAYSLFIDIVYIFKRLEDDRLLADLLARYESFNEVTRLGVEAYNEVVGAGQIVQSTLTTLAGWHMVGMPAEPVDPDYLSVYAGIDLQSAPWRWTSDGYASVTNLAMGEGYWINAQSEGSAIFLGTENRSLTYPNLPAGWTNLAGPSCDLPVADVLDAYAEVDPNLVFGWQPEEGYVGLSDGDVIAQGIGFWVFLSTEVSLTLTCPEDGAASGKTRAAVAAFKPEDNGFQFVTLTDATGRSRSLYFGNEVPVTIASSFALPPTPPPGAFDIRFVEDTSLLQGEAQRMDILVSTNRFPVTLQMNAGYVVEEMVGEQVVATRAVPESGRLQLTNRAVSKLRVRQE